MPPSHLAIIRQHCQPLEPEATHVTPVLSPQRGIRCVLFDVYGTLLVSASGEVGTVAEENRARAMVEALASVGLRLSPAKGLSNAPRAAARCLLETIRAAHQEACRGGVEFPEVEILSIWRQTLTQLTAQQMLSASGKGVDVARLAIEYEMRTNPTWPMPGARDCLRALAARHQRLGIVSNAQFFTELLFPAFFDQTPGELGFDPRLQFYSYRYKWAKPGLHLYELAASELSQQGVPVDNVLYIGNDMLNDVAAAARVGFRTALFAGDARSLRLRSGDDRVGRIQPDLVVTDLMQLIGSVE